MKLFKSSILALSAFAAVAFTACSDDNGYVPAEPSNGLYFDQSSSTTYELPKDASSFTVDVFRQGLTDAASYAVNVTVSANGSDVFTLPDVAVFAEGAAEGTITIGYDAAKMDPEATYEFTVLIAENTPACAFGANGIAFEAVLRPNFSEWEPFEAGQGTYYYGPTGDLLFEISEDPGLPVVIRYNTEVANKAQLCIQHWGRDMDLIIDYDTATNICTIPGQGTGVGVNVGSVFEMCITDIYTYAKTIGDESAEEFAEYSFYDPETGTLNLCAAYYIVDAGEWYTLQFNDGTSTVGYETFQLDGFKNYDVALEYAGYYTNADFESSAIIKATVSGEASKALLLMRRDATPQQVLAQIQAGADDVVALTPGATDEVIQLPLSGAATYTVVAATFEGDELKKATQVQFTIDGGIAEDPTLGFHRVGVAEICDAWITAGYSFTSGDDSALTYEQLVWDVELYESDETSGLYLLLNPWLSPDAIVNYPFSSGVINLNSRATSVKIDATNDKCVVIAPQYSGCTIALRSGDAPIWISNGDGYYLTPAFAEAVELPAVLTKQDLIDMNLATPFNDGDISIPEAVYGFSEEEFGYILNLGTSAAPIHPEGYIAMRFDDQASSPRRVARQIELRSATRNNFEAKRIVNNAFSFKKQKTLTKSSHSSIKLNKGIIRL